MRGLSGPAKAPHLAGPLPDVRGDGLERLLSLRFDVARGLEEQLIEGVLSLELDHVHLELLLGGRGLSPELVEPWVGDALGGLPHVDEVSGAAALCASVTVDADGHGVSPCWIDELWNHETRQSHRRWLPGVAS